MLPYLLRCCVSCVHAVQCIKLFSLCGKQSSYIQGMHSVSRNKMQRKIGKDVRRAWDWDRCLQDVCQGILIFENFPTEVANICTEKFQACTTAGNITESSLLLESLCRINWMGLFPGLFQSKLMELMWCCCPVFTTASLEGESMLSTSAILKCVCAPAYA